MRINMISIANKMPSWVEQGCDEYQRRLPAEFKLRCLDIAMPNRGKAGQRARPADIAKARDNEGKLMLAAIPADDVIVALDVNGKAWSTDDLSERFADWQMQGNNLSLLIGGPDGLASSCLQKAHQKWSLSALTFPHPLVRVIIAEQIYRAWTLLNNHPYHR